jgi:hypothetical protein
MQAMTVSFTIFICASALKMGGLPDFARRNATAETETSFDP